MNGPGVSIESLAWDSEFFGFPVVRLVPGGERAIDEAVAQLRADGTRLAYLDLDLTEDTTKERALNLGARWVGTRVELVTRELDVARPDDVFLLGHHPDAEDLRALHELAIASGERSRFRIDPDITEQQFHRLYGLWIERGISGGPRDAVLIAREGGSISAMISIAMKDGVGVIGLFAVGAEYRGRGLGGRLLRGALGWSKQNGASSVRVATQADNVGALATYDASKFTIVHQTNTFHFWIR